MFSGSGDEKLGDLRLQEVSKAVLLPVSQRICRPHGKSSEDAACVKPLADKWVQMLNGV